RDWFRATKITLKWPAAKSLAISRPMPADAPVISAHSFMSWRGKLTWRGQPAKGQTPGGDGGIDKRRPDNLVNPTFSGRAGRRAAADLFPELVGAIARRTSRNFSVCPPIHLYSAVECADRPASMPHHLKLGTAPAARLCLIHTAQSGSSHPAGKGSTAHRDLARSNPPRLLPETPVHQGEPWWCIAVEAHERTGSR